MSVLGDQVLPSISFQAVVAFWSVPVVVCAGLRSDVKACRVGSLSSSAHLDPTACWHVLMLNMFMLLRHLVSVV